MSEILVLYGLVIAIINLIGVLTKGTAVKRIFIVIIGFFEAIKNRSERAYTKQSKKFSDYYFNFIVCLSILVFITITVQGFGHKYSSSLIEAIVIFFIPLFKIIVTSLIMFGIARLVIYCTTYGKSFNPIVSFVFYIIFASSIALTFLPRQDIYHSSYYYLFAQVAVVYSYIIITTPIFIFIFLKYFSIIMLRLILLIGKYSAILSAIIGFALAIYGLMLYYNPQ